MNHRKSLAVEQSPIRAFPSSVRWRGFASAVPVGSTKLQKAIGSSNRMTQSFCLIIPFHTFGALCGKFWFTIDLIRDGLIRSNNSLKVVWLYQTLENASRGALDTKTILHNILSHLLVEYTPSILNSQNEGTYDTNCLLVPYYYNTLEWQNN